MTDQLTRLLHDAGRDVDVPFPPSREVLARGQARRRRRTAALTAGGSVAAVLVLVGALGLTGGGDRAVEPVAPDSGNSPSFAGVTFAIGNEVYLDGGESSVTIEDRAVKSLYYSSAGVIVRHGNNSASDGGGPQRFTLVRPDGTTSPISVETEENAHGVDPTQPYLSWTEEVPGGVEVVVHDVEADTEVARVEVEGPFEWSPPPVALDGDTVYVGGTEEQDDTLLAVDWRTGEVTDSGVAGYYPEVAGGRTVVYDRPALAVVDVATGDDLVDASAFDTLLLAPGGRFAVASAFDYGTEETDVAVYDVDTGRGVRLDTDATGSGLVGWSTGQQPFAVQGDTLSVCSPTTGRCASRDVTELAQATDGGGNLDVRLGGVLYES